MPSKVIIVIEFMFAGINIFWALLRAHFNPRLTARAKMSLSRAQNIFMPANINSKIVLFLLISVNNGKIYTSSSKNDCEVLLFFQNLPRL